MIPLRFYIILAAAGISLNAAIYFLAHAQFISTTIAGGLTGIFSFVWLVMLFHELIIMALRAVNAWKEFKTLGK